MNLYYEDIFNILKEYNQKQSFLKNILDIYIKNNKRDDYSTITDYTYGIVRNDIFLNFLIKKFVKKIKSKDKIYLKILFYGIIFRKNTKNEIFVNDFIRFAKKKYGTKQSGFYNGVIRNFLRNKNILNEVKTNKQIYNSIPLELFNYINKNIKDKKLKNKIFDKMVEVPNFYFNTRKIIKDELKDKIKDNHIWNNIYRFDEKLRLSDLKEELLNGNISIQDISSQMISYILEAKESDYIADFCAAPGGKSRLLSEISNNNTKILSIELDKYRYEKMKSSFENYKNITPLLLDATSPIVINTEKQLFDKILVDAPCSALGTISKSPDKKYRFKDIKLNEYTDIQVKILNNALKHLKPGGILLFTLCTFTKEECIDTVNIFLEENKNTVELFDFETPDNKFKGNKLHTANYYDGDLFFITKFRKL